MISLCLLVSPYLKLCSLTFTLTPLTSLLSITRFKIISALEPVCSCCPSLFFCQICLSYYFLSFTSHLKNLNFSKRLLIEMACTQTKRHYHTLCFNFFHCIYHAKLSYTLVYLLTLCFHFPKWKFRESMDSAMCVS